ncbi:helicase POLQ-like isoform X2 [Bacillus rossius redtenbacheri]|uniref:helicase POLQ-like isoform X2 n=1 Tax=Bacillus rossius redtenbacheri TaxID=93214 RepID=UPI002FDDF90E
MRVSTCSYLLGTMTVNSQCVLKRIRLQSMDECDSRSSSTYRSPAVKRLGVRSTPRSTKRPSSCGRLAKNSTPRHASETKSAHFGNITPIRSRGAGGAAAVRKRVLEHDSTASVQTEMLMLDETFLQTVDLDRVENGRSAETPRGQSPDLFADEDSFSFPDNGEAARVAGRLGRASEACLGCGKDGCHCGAGASGDARAPAPHDVSATWTDDSALEEAMKATLLSCQGSVPLGEKIKKALLGNAQKAVKPKIKTDPPSPTTLSALEVDGPFFGLPLKVRQLIEETKGISELYPWQEECLGLAAVRERRNLVVCLPTSGGKTLVAEVLVLRELLCHRRNALLVLPYVAIVQEKVRSLSSLAVPLGFLVEEYAAGRGGYPPRRRRWKNTVYVATIEKALGLVGSLVEHGRLDELGLLVVDELHLLGDAGGRGANLEILLAKLLHSAADLHIVGMSATIGNLDEVAAFLRAETFCRDFRPVELREYVKCADRIFSIDWSAKSPEEMCTLSRVVKPKDANDPDYIAGLVLEVAPEESVLVFCPTKKNCENIALLVCRAMNRDILEHKLEEKKALYRALVTEGNGSVCSTLQKTLPFGVAYHHSGLVAGERRLLEEAYCAGTLCCVCCTSTLAAGVNLPAARVVLRSPYVGTQFLTMSRYKQMAGRAGRAGTGCRAGESILVCAPADVDKVQGLVGSRMDRCESGLALADGHGVRSLVLTAVAQGLAGSRAALHALARRTLLHVQAERAGHDVPGLVDRAVVELFREGALRSPAVAPDQSVCVTPHAAADRTRVVLRRETLLAVSRLGRGAIKGCMDLRKARLLYEDLVQAQSSLVLLTSLHLLYLVTPYELAEQYNELSAKEQLCAKVLGLSEGCMVRIGNGQTPKNVAERVVRRFYLTLMLAELWRQESVWRVAAKYQVSRGFVQGLMTSAAAFAACVMRFCEELQELWAFKELLVTFSLQLSHCCTQELLPLMELPAVKKGRAQQLYNAGFKSLHDIANTSIGALVSSVDHLSRKVAGQIIAAARLLLLEKVESLREEAQEVLEGMAAVRVN